MLNPVIKNRRRKRRKRKTATAATANIAIDVDERNSEHSDESLQIVDKHQIYSPKVNVKFINEDAEIETAIMLKHLNRDSEMLRKKEYDLKFFVTYVTAAELLDLSKTQSTIDYKIYKDVENNESCEPSMHENIVDGPQLTAFYINNDFTDIVKPFDKQQLDNSGVLQFYVPKLMLPKQLLTDIEQPTNTIIFLPESGHFVEQKPSILNRNRAQYINRLFEEEAFHWFHVHTKEIRHLFNINVGQHLTRTRCAEQIHPIEYQPMDFAHEMDANFVQDRILRIHLKDIIFDKHPSFNEEQQIAAELEILYDEYVRQCQANILETIETKLNVLRRLLDTVSNQTRNNSTVNDNLRTYRGELKEMRSLWHCESIKQRQLLQNILEHWSNLKKTRQTATIHSTGIRLIIKSREPDIDQDTYEWNHRFSMEFNEMLQDATAFCREQKQQRKKKSKRNGADGIDGGASNAKITKPNANSIENVLLKLFGESMRSPGEHFIDLELERTIATGQNNYQPKYVVRVLLDNEHLQFPASQNLNSIAQASFNSTYSIKFTTRLPQRLKFLIYERNQFNAERKIAEVNGTIPMENDLFQSTNTIAKEFVGAVARQCTGKITYCIGWSSELNAEREKSSTSQTPNQIISTKANLKGTVGTWFSDQLIDPMDPQNSTLTEFIDNSGPKALTKGENSLPKKNEYRLYEDVYAFCSRHKFDENKRIELLNARFNSDLKLKDCKLIPHNEVEIELPVDLKIFEDMLWVDPIDVQRYQGKKYLKHIYDIITNHCEVINRNMTHRDLLIGDTAPTLSGALEAFTNIFSPRRPLNPYRKTIIRRSSFREDNISRFNVVVNIVRASGIPYRSRDEVMASRRTSLASTIQNIHRHTNVRPFVTVTFRDKILRTSTVDSSNPTWNEQIVIPINESINQIKDSLWFHIYDEIIEDLPSNDSTSASEICQRMSSHYLGELLIPFSTIYASQRVEGTFQMTTPLILLGYTKPTVNVPDNGIDSFGGSIETRQSILISLLISIEPIIELNNFSTAQLECIELKAIQYRINQWVNEFTEEFLLRAQDPLISLANGKRVCITRLIGTIDIPFERNETAEHMIRRFVSLIPVRPHKNICTKLNGIWLTNDQLLNILIASPKDLGVLLTCYYLSLGFEAYLVLGFAIPYGDTTFTLIKDSHEYYLIDPHSGRKCSSRDTFGALTKVYCLVNQHNVWANIQREHRVFMQHFDVTQSTEWHELFTKTCPAPQESVHDLSLPYTNSLDCDNLRRSIEIKIMKKITVWRMERKTIWNRRYVDLLLSILKDLEQDRCFDIEQKMHVDRLIEATQGKYKTAGFPINMPYVSIPKIIDHVKATKIYMNTSVNVEFSLAVYIQPYPMNIFSVWVFILALFPRIE